MGIEIGTGYDFPFDVRVRLDDEIGGPSAGLIFSLAVYDTLTPGSLTGGAHVAGTGTHRPETDASAPIGGIQQKIVAAADAGAELFLVPADNCRAARGADVARRTRSGWCGPRPCTRPSRPWRPTPPTRRRPAEL